MKINLDDDNVFTFTLGVEKVRKLVDSLPDEYDELADALDEVQAPVFTNKTTQAILVIYIEP
jgi:hypothetical protein